MLFHSTISNTPFKKWFWQDSENRLLLWFSVIVIVLQFAVFKFLYPDPNFMPPDSDSYIEAAFTNRLINIWPIGYSKFLRLFSCLTSSDVALVWFQYLLLQGSILYLLLSIRYLLTPGKWLFRVLQCINIFNPLLVQIGNFISSDALFTALSLLWFAQLLWILYQPNTRLLIWHAVVIVFAFMVRYNALLYPCISILAILTARVHLRQKLSGIGAILLLCGAYTASTVWAYYKETGTPQFSAFGGWLMGSNVLYGYAYAQPDPVESMPAGLRPLHTVVNRHMDSIKVLVRRPDEEVGIYYFWDFHSPLREYMAQQWKKDTVTDFLTRWVSMGPLYADYGRYLAQRHPWLYLRYYGWPNFVKYYAPPAKFMGFYNLGEERVAPMTAQWFGWKDTELHSYFKDRIVTVTAPFSIISAIINVLFICCFTAFVSLGGFKQCTEYNRRILWWMLVIWLGNMLFSIISAPIELRYQLFPLIITAMFLVLISDPLIIAGLAPGHDSKRDVSRNPNRAALSQV